MPEAVRASPAGHPPSSRCNHTATLVGTTLCIYGGASGEWEYDHVLAMTLHAWHTYFPSSPTISLCACRYDHVLAMDTRTYEWRQIGLDSSPGVLPLPRHATSPPSPTTSVWACI